MPSAVRELRQIPFGYLIGAPMKAAIEAQALAAKTTVEFIEKVGFKEKSAEETSLFGDLTTDADTGDVRNVTFSYKRTQADGTLKDVTLSVPILSIVPIPYIRIDDMTIDFTAKLTDQIEQTQKSDFNVSAQTAGKFKSWWSPVSMEFRTSMSYATSRASASKFVREYTMQIKVKAVQDDMPAGLERVLDILEQTIKETPKAP